MPITTEWPQQKLQHDISPPKHNIELFYWKISQTDSSQ